MDSILAGLRMEESFEIKRHWDSVVVYQQCKSIGIQRGAEFIYTLLFDDDQIVLAQEKETCWEN